jgi:hypothetical protein
MVATVMITNFLIEYDRVFSLSAPSYTDAEIIQFLDRAQYDIVDTLHRNRRYDLLDGLISTATDASPGAYSLFAGAKTSLVTGTEYTRYLYYIDSYSKVARSALPSMSSTVIKNEYIDRMQAKDFQTSDFNSPIFRFPKVYVEGVYITVIPDAFTTISEIYVDYVVNPKGLDKTVDSSSLTTECELRESLHGEVVTKAVQFAQIATNPEMAGANIKLTNKE